MKKIMIVDDTKFMRTMLKQMLSQFKDIEVIEAADGEESVALYKKFQPDIVTMDMEMRTKNGLQALQEIVSFNPKAKIIMITSDTEQEQLYKCIKSGVIDYILKPFSSERLLNTIKTILSAKPQLEAVYEKN